MTPLHFDFLLFDGFSNLVLGSALEPFRDVSKRLVPGAITWSITSLDGQTVESSSHVHVHPDAPFNPKGAGRYLILIAGYDVRRHTTAEVLGPIRTAARFYDQVIALDTAAWILAEAGLLAGKPATIHWQEFDNFAYAYPNVDVVSDSFAKAGKVTTSGSAGSAMELILSIIEDHFGHRIAYEASYMFASHGGVTWDMNFGDEKLRESLTPHLKTAIKHMTAHLDAPLSTFDLADRVGTSERTLNRTFQRELGITTGKYYQNLRLKNAQYLLVETKLSAAEIALKCGFSCASSLSRAFQKLYGVSLSDFRKTA